MAQAAQQISAYNLPELRLIKGGASNSRSTALEIAPTREMFFLAGALIVLQILDGVLTGIGVGHFGAAAEGNPLLRELMHSVGHIPALIIVKTIAIFVILALLSLSVRVRWVSPALKVMIGLYLFAAIIPWTGIILFKMS